MLNVVISHKLWFIQHVYYLSPPQTHCFTSTTAHQIKYSWCYSQEIEGNLTTKSKGEVVDSVLVGIHLLHDIS